MPNSVLSGLTAVDNLANSSANNSIKGVMHNAMKISVLNIGYEKNTVIVMDNFHPAAETLIDLACTEPPFAGQKSDYYPGLRKLIGGDYAEQSLAIVAPILKEFFAVNDEYTPKVSLAAFSLATTPTQQLRPIQCVPHIDTHDQQQFALVHYLCAEHYGGTSFYRHKATGHESITTERLEHYFRTLKQEVTSGGLPALEYINGDTALFERIGNVPVQFNRAVLYRSNALHSGNISEILGLSHNPREGRLTANVFIHYSA